MTTSIVELLRLRESRYLPKVAVLGTAVDDHAARSVRNVGRVSLADVEQPNDQLTICLALLLRVEQRCQRRHCYGKKKRTSRQLSVEALLERERHREP